MSDVESTESKGTGPSVELRSMAAEEACDRCWGFVISLVSSPDRWYLGFFIIDSGIEMSDIGGRFFGLLEGVGVDNGRVRKEGTIYGIGRAFIAIAWNRSRRRENSGMLAAAILSALCLTDNITVIKA